ncbi:hypothetical protein [Nitrososphaera sp.]|uniref:hypothetical protein n=1 Tax=Nitrososphaera sp. TaxID=1971748 RepID=UPI00307E530B
MNYFQRGAPAAWMAEPGSRVLIAGYVLVSTGILLAISGATWDVTYHLLNRPETFFSPPHAVLYSGVTTALAGAVALAYHHYHYYHHYISAGKNKRIIGEGFAWPAGLAIAGVAMLIAAGPGDFIWHSAFGLDGLLSPPHSVLLSGMVISSVGAAAGLVRTYGGRIPLALAAFAMLPVWISASAGVHMASLPFSDTDFFNFNPEPRAGALAATLGFPFVTGAVLLATWGIAGRRFGAISVLAASFVAVGTLASIIPNEALVPTAPLYAGVLVPLVAADAIMSKWMSRRAIVFAGAIIGLSFFMLYYPLITHTYNEVVENKSVWPSLTGIIYFELAGTVFPLVAAPGAAMGIAGAIAGQRLAARAELGLLK